MTEVPVPGLDHGYVVDLHRPDLVSLLMPADWREQVRGVAEYGSNAVVRLMETWLLPTLDMLRTAHHIPYVDEEHQGGNCVDWVLPLLSRLFKAEGAIAQARRWCDKTESAAKSEPLSLRADEAVFQARMQLVDEVRALLREVAS